MGRKRARRHRDPPRPGEGTDDLVSPSENLPLPHRIALLCVLLLLALLAFRQIGSLDTGFHLAAGNSILDGNGWPRNDTFTYTVTDHAYIDTSWGFQVAIALVERAAGAPGLVLFVVAVSQLTFLLLLKTARLAPLDPTSLVVLTLLSVLAVEMRLEVRPETVSYLILAALLYLLQRRALGLPAPLWTLPLLTLLWVNVHALFVLGWAAMGCFLLGLALRDRRIDRPLLAWSAASLPIALLNPYGWRAIAFPLTLATRFGGSNEFAQSIGELVSPFALVLTARMPFYPVLPVNSFRLLAILSLAGAVVWIARRRWWCLLLWLVFLPLALRMIRNMPLLVVGCLPCMVWALPLSGLVARLGPTPRRRRLLVTAVAVVIALFSIATSLRVVHDAYYIASRRVDRFGWSWNSLTLPIDAARYVRQSGIAEGAGRMLNHLNFGGYLIWALGRPVFIDGRLEVIGEDFYSAYDRVLSSDAAMEACVARYGIGWAIIPYGGNPALLQRLAASPRWELAYFDHLAAVFVRAGPGADRFIDPEISLVPIAPPPEAVRDLPGLSGGRRASGVSRWISGLYRREEFPSDDHYRAIFHLYLGRPGAAEAHLCSAIRRCGGAYYELYANLAAALLHEGRDEEAAGCYRVVLEDDPENEAARTRLEALP